MLPHYETMVDKGRIDPAARPAVVHDAGAILALDGRHGWGQAIAGEAVELAAARARVHGIGCVLARDTGHVGRLGAYTTALADAGLASLMLVSSQGGDLQMAPHGGREKRLTNNPISFGAPGGAGPAVAVDVALSVLAGGKVVLAGQRGERLPEGAIVDVDGDPSTDPRDFFADGRIAGGMLLPVGGHKGSGLIVLAELLAGLLSGGGTVRADAPERSSNAFLLLAIDIEPLVPEGDGPPESPPRARGSRARDRRPASPACNCPASRRQPAPRAVARMASQSTMRRGRHLPRSPRAPGSRAACGRRHLTPATGTRRPPACASAPRALPLAQLVEAGRVHELARVVGARPLQHIAGVALLDDVAVLHDDGAVAQVADDG